MDTRNIHETAAASQQPIRSGAGRSKSEPIRQKSGNDTDDDMELLERDQ